MSHDCDVAACEGPTSATRRATASVPAAAMARAILLRRLDGSLGPMADLLLLRVGRGWLGRWSCRGGSSTLAITFEAVSPARVRCWRRIVSANIDGSRLPPRRDLFKRTSNDRGT